MARFTALLLSAAFATAASSAGGVRAEVVGGTLEALRKNTSSRLDFSDVDSLFIRCDKAEFRIPYHTIRVIEYGQTVGRRYISALLISPILLLSKARKHFLTLEFISNGKTEAVVFRVNKNDVRAALASVEARTGRSVDYLDDEARKSGR